MVSVVSTRDGLGDSRVRRSVAFRHHEEIISWSEGTMKLIVRLQERLRFADGQTMTEYALILATVAAVVVSMYNTSGVYLKGLVEHINSFL